MYVMLVGNPGTRKSTAIKGIVKVIAAAGFTAFAADKTNKEKFLMDLAGEQGSGGGRDSEEAITNLFGSSASNFGDPREMYIPADEFNEFVGGSVGSLDFLSLLGSLWQRLPKLLSRPVRG